MHRTLALDVLKMETVRLRSLVAQVTQLHQYPTFATLHRTWLPFLLTKAITRENVEAHEVTAHFDEYGRYAPALPEKVIAKKYHEALHGFYRLKSIKRANGTFIEAVEGSIMYADGVMAVAIYIHGELLTLYSGAWETTDEAEVAEGLKGTVHHYALAGRISAMAIKANPHANEPGGKFKFREREFVLSDDQKSLALNEAGLTLNWVALDHTGDA